MYVQCHLRKDNIRQVSWLPVQFAEVGKILSLKEEEGWEDNWIISSVGDIQLSDAVLLERGRDYLNTRKASDI